MKNTRLTVSVGIPVYNEEHNIAKLLKLLESQRQTNYSLLEILVFTDGCTDDTVKIIKNFKTKIIKLKIGNERLGQQLRQNQIIKARQGNVLVIIEGDTLPENEYTLERLVKPFVDNKAKNLGMVVGNDCAVMPKTFFEKIIFNSDKLKHEIFDHLNKGINIYTTGGHSMRAFSKEFTKYLEWPKDAPEDSYVYLRIRELGFTILRQKDAKSYMRNVTHIKDRTRQSAKFVSGKRALFKYFPDDLIKSEYYVPKRLIIGNLIAHFAKNPFWTTASIFEQIINIFLTSKTDKVDAIFNIYPSTKTLEV